MKKYVLLTLFLIVLLALAGCGSESTSSGPTLPGADEIYPSVLVSGKLYEWRRGAAILDELPQSSNYCASIEHTNGNILVEDGEFVSTFDVTGDIYTVPEDDSCVYLVLSTNWTENAVVIFDKVPD